MVFDIEEIEREYYRLRKLGEYPEKQAELNGIMYGYKMGLKDSSFTGSRKVEK